MGLFGKERVGLFKAADNSGRRFTWTIQSFSSHRAGATLDSENVTSFAKVKFHFHMSFGKSGDIGLYIHYKKPPIPKYSYYFQNSKQEVMRQHTAHTIPEDSERCGHWNVCSHRDMKEFLGEDDTLFVQLVFDDDSIVLNRISESGSSALWAIPNLGTQNLNPYSSSGFYVDGTLLVARLDVKRSGGDTVTTYNYGDVHTFIIFLFCRKGIIPPHSVELVDASGNPYYRVEESDDGSALTVMVDRAVIHENVARDGGTLFVKLLFRTSGNPLEALNALGHLSSSSGGGGGGEREQVTSLNGGRRGEGSDRKLLYNVMDD
ncbi:hypothetical protein JKF63_06685 [Porcisia hertigi]|uniref:Uncharacterized protein n=1 Tax=Porcisia hertigi TaxID=2761500 RepID=A0A836LH38_9TRYP|nr:hypothetical protein JKF63_06685 [Porcisia hertigi]